MSSQSKKGSTYIREDADVLDLLDPRLVSKVVTARPKKRANAGRSREDDFEHAEDGRMVVEDESEDERVRQRSSKKARSGDVEMEDAEEEDFYTEAITGESSYARTAEGKVRFGSGKKKGRSAESFGAEDGAPTKKAAWPEAQQRAFDAKRAKTAKMGRVLDNPDVARMLGKQYKPKKAMGDVKRPGMADPHAYIPLTSKIVGNKRKGVKAASTFKKIVGAAQRGVKKASVKFPRTGGRGKR